MRSLQLSARSGYVHLSVYVSWAFEVTPKCDDNQGSVRKEAVEASA